MADIINVDTSIIDGTNIEYLTGEHLKIAANAINDVRIRANRLSHDAQQMMLEVAYRMYEIKANKWYEEDGFKSISEFANSVFGYKPNMTSKMVASGTRITRNSDGKYTTIFGDFGMTQLFEMASLKNEQITTAILNGDINSNMSCARIRENVRALKGFNDGNSEVDSTNDSRISNDSDSSDVSSNKPNNDSTVVGKRTNKRNDVNNTNVKNLSDSDITKLLHALLNEIDSRGTEFGMTKKLRSRIIAFAETLNNEKSI